MALNKNSFKVGYLLASTRIIRSGLLSNLLIVLVMTLTFLNLLVVRGILIGLPAGAVEANRRWYYADVFISVKEGKKHIQKQEYITNLLDEIDGIKHYAIRYLTSGVVEADYDKRLKNDEQPNLVNARIVGLNFKDEDELVGISDAILEGRFFQKDSLDEVVIGKDLVSKFESGEIRGTSSLDNVDIGTEIELTINNITKKLKVVGFTSAKVNELDSVIIISQNLMSECLNREDFKPDEIAIRIHDNYTPEQIKAQILEMGVPADINVETPEEYQPSFVEDIIDTFSILGDLIGSVSLAVAAITVFIIIFVNAITQKKQIGILKGIGISPVAIEISYILQAVLYVTIGALISIPLLYGVLVPYFIQNPIDFPFSDGVIVAEYSATISRTLIMFVITGLAGYLPAKYIVDQNTLDAILGRK